MLFGLGRDHMLNSCLRMGDQLFFTEIFSFFFLREDTRQAKIIDLHNNGAVLFFLVYKILTNIRILPKHAE